MRFAEKILESNADQQIQMHAKRQTELMLKRLMRPTGEIMPEACEPMMAPACFDKIVRPAILIHSGPNGSEMTLESSNGEISFDAARIRDIVMNHNAMIERLAADYGGLGMMPIGAFPPILDQHENDSNDRIVGRLNFLLRYEVRDVPGVGKDCACAMTDITFLGEEPVKKVQDGRIYHLSVGISDKEDSRFFNTLGEVSTVIEPAAPGAMLLKKGKTKPKGDTMSKKRLAAAKKRLAAMSEIKSSLAKIGKSAKDTSDSMKQLRAENSVRSRLTKLCAAKKMTPAEFKKMDMTKLAKLESGAMDILMGAFEARETVVVAGQRGATAGAIDFASMKQDMDSKQRAQLKAEARGDLKRLKKNLKFKDSEEGDDKSEKKMGSAKFGDKVDKKELGGDADGKDEKKMSADKGSEPGDKDVQDLANGKDIPEPLTEDQQKTVDGLSARVDEMTTQIARLAGILDELMTSEKEEEAEMSGDDEEGGEEKELGAEGDEKEKKLGEGKEAGDEKKLEGDEDEDEESEMSAGEDEKEKKLGAEDGKEKEKKDAAQA